MSAPILSASPHEPTQVRAAIAAGARATGADFDFLLQTATRESALDPRAKATTSSAAGLFQFVEQTWLGLLARHGAEHGLGEASQAITRTASGRYEIADPAKRAEILALRYEPEEAARMAGELVRESAATLRGALSRAPTSGELYAAHFLGAGGAARLIDAAARTPDACAADLFPEAAAANRAIFYDGSGTARCASDVLARVTALPGDAAPAPTAEPPRLRGPLTLGLGQDGGEASIRYAPPPQAALRLTPDILMILSSLDPLAGRDEREADARAG